MDVIIPRCAGLDVHKQSVQVCVRLLGPEGVLELPMHEMGSEATKGMLIHLTTPDRGLTLRIELERK